MTDTYDRHGLLRVYAYYRVLLALLLLGLSQNIFWSGTHPVGSQNPLVFGYTINVYTLITLVTLARLYGSAFQPSDQHIFLICFVDITCLTLLMHTSGGIESGLGLLLLVTVSAASITLRMQIATLIAALATLSLLASAVYQILYSQVSTTPLFLAGLLGFLLFVTSQLFLYLTQRIRASTEEVELQTRRRLEAQQLNESIIRRMRTGLVVLAPNGSVRMLNESAALLLGLPRESAGSFSVNLSFAEIPALYQSLQQWRQTPHARPKPLRLREGGPELQLSFAGLDSSQQSDVLVFVEDSREIAQQAQQLKLASLGQLTASIAHEVRNPLGAISHAAQLLAEAPEINAGTRRLTDIIHHHSTRVSEIIDNVLQLSRRDKTQPLRISLCEFLQSFVKRYQQSHPEPHRIDIVCDEAPLEVTLDPSQFEQALSNLCDNGLRYSARETEVAHVLLHGYLDHSLGTPCLDIIDDGVGIAREHEGRIFEPFFTTEARGTGLGLYLAREICEANQALLDYRRTADGKSCFHISFAHPDKSVTFPLDTTTKGPVNGHPVKSVV